MFKQYQGKAVSRFAHEVTSADTITKQDEEATSSIVIGGELVKFKHYEPVKEGDFVVMLTKDDTYHCSKKVFLDRNHVSGFDLDFGTAINAMKSGSKVARKGWNGSGMFVWLDVGGKTVSIGDFMAGGKPDSSKLFKTNPHYLLKTAQNDVAVWAPSVSDSLAEDWYVVN